MSCMYIFVIYMHIVIHYCVQQLGFDYMLLQNYFVPTVSLQKEIPDFAALCCFMRG